MESNADSTEYLLTISTITYTTELLSQVNNSGTSSQQDWEKYNVEKE